RTLTRILAAPLLIAAALSVHAAPAAALDFSACQNGSGFSCATATVPLDHSGRLPGSISLALERKIAGAGPSQSAVVALAGCPDQSVLPLGDYISSAISPALGARDLLLFDQRGTGASDPLGCAALGSVATGVRQMLERCALQIGPARGAFTTQQSVEDIE